MTSVYCTLILSIIVILTLVHSLPTKIQCPDYFTPLNAKKCVKYSQASATYNMAILQCEKHDGELVSINNAIDNVGVLNMFYTSEDPIWVGLKCTGSVDSCVWADGSGKPTYTNFAPGNPTNLTDGCVIMYNTGPFRGKWFSEHCYEIHSFVCETDPLSSKAAQLN